MINANYWYGTQQNINKLHVHVWSNASNMAGGTLSLTKALSNFKTPSSLSARNVAHAINVLQLAYNAMKHQLVLASACLSMK